MTNLSVCLALLEPTASASRPTWLEPWMNRPEFLIPIGIGVCLLLLVAILKARELPSQMRARGKSTMDPLQLEELMIGTPPIILDIRSEPEYRGERGHIRGAVNIPFALLEKRLDELDTSHPRPIVLVDENDVLSYQAFPLVAARGHTWLYVLRGGMKAWRRAKLPTYVFQGKPKH
jgi:3-mercaptopyruvate sulfurtransferase SseA